MILRDGRVVSSYSQIDKHEKCNYNWFMKYVLEVKDSAKSKHLDYGLASHETMQFAVELVELGVVPEFDEIDVVLTMALAKFDVQYSSESEKEEWIKAVVARIERFINVSSEIDRMIMDKDTEILGIEMPFELPIEMPPFEITNEAGEKETHDMVYIIGFIDLVLRTKDGIVVIDYKSGGKKFDKAKLRSDLQFPIYNMAVKMIFGEEPIACYYDFTRINEVQKVLVTDFITAEMTEIMNKRGAKEIYCIPTEEAERKIKSKFREMLKDDQPPCATALCYWCDFGYHNSGMCIYSSEWKPKDK